MLERSNSQIFEVILSGSSKGNFQLTCYKTSSSTCAPDRTCIQISWALCHVEWNFTSILILFTKVQDAADITVVNLSPCFLWYLWLSSCPLWLSHFPPLAPLPPPFIHRYLILLWKVVDIFQGKCNY